jgi:hypothetical protein
MKIIGFLIILVILLSYSLSIPMEGCEERGHLTSSHLDCGSLFHCPITNSSPHILSSKHVGFKIEEGSEGSI